MRGHGCKPGEIPQLTGATRLYKHDLESGERREFGPGRELGEFVFVSASEAATEDEGWLLGLVIIDTRTDTTDLVILDARTFEAQPVAVVHLPHRVPPGFHGKWFPDLAS